MRLTRRDALAVLAGLGILGGASAAVATRQHRIEQRDSGSTATDAAATDAADAVPEPVLQTLTAAAEVLYPSGVGGHYEFVETYALGRLAGRPAYREGLVGAVEMLDARAQSWYGDPYAVLGTDTRDAVLRELGANTAAPNPDGSDAERVRFFVVNDLLYAFFTSPTGGELAGTENPIGHPGGTESYQRGP